MAQEPMRIHVEFFMDAVEDRGASEREGRKIFKDVESVRIRWVGDNKRELIAPAHMLSVRDGNEWITYAQRFPDQYEAFRRNVTYIGSGTPIDEAPFLSNAEKAELKALNIFTIDALADLTSKALAALGMGGREKMNKAKAWLENAAGSADVTRMAAENAQMREQMERMQKQMDELMRKGAAPATPVHVEPEQADPDDDADVSNSPFASWDDPTIKAYIKDKTGNMPRGNPSHETLVRMADEANALSREAA